MTEFMGKKVPPRNKATGKRGERVIDYLRKNTPQRRQFVECGERGCGNLLCNNCLFGKHSVQEFLMWESE